MSKKTTEPEVRLNYLLELIEAYCTEEWKQLVDLQKTIEVYPRKSIIFKEGQSIEHLHIVNHGKAKVFASLGNDKERIIRLAGDGQVLGHRGFGGDFTYSVTARALTEVEATLIPLQVFQNLLKANSLFCYYFMLFFSEELRRSERQIKNLTNLDVPARVAMAICMNQEAFGFDDKEPTLLDFTIARKDIASVAGTTYESVVRTLAEFDKKGIIQISGKQLHVLNKQAIVDVINS